LDVGDADEDAVVGADAGDERWRLGAGDDGTQRARERRRQTRRSSRVSFRARNIADDQEPACELELVHGEHVTGKDGDNSSGMENPWGRAEKDVVSHRNFVGEGMRLNDVQNVMDRKKSIRWP
jgi:hypothetical protein